MTRTSRRAWLLDGLFCSGAYLADVQQKSAYYYKYGELQWSDSTDFLRPWVVVVVCVCGGVGSPVVDT